MRVHETVNKWQECKNAVACKVNHIAIEICCRCSDNIFWIAKAAAVQWKLLKFFHALKWQQNCNNFWAEGCLEGFAKFVEFFKANLSNFTEIWFKFFFVNFYKFSKPCFKILQNN